VVDDDASCRALVVGLLERIGCGTYEAANGQEALAVADAVRPALVVLDVSIPGVTGYEICHELRQTYGDDIGIVFLSGTRVEALDRVAGMLIGADDYIVKPFDPDELLVRVRSVLRRQGGQRAENDQDAEQPDEGDDVLEELTAREREVLMLLADGHSQTEIAGNLYISTKTVGTHIQRVLAKLGVHSRAQAVAVAHRAGVVPEVQAHGFPHEHEGQLAPPLAPV